MSVMRDYRLSGPSGRAAVQNGLAQATWYQTALPKQAMNSLVQREDDIAFRDTCLLLGLMLVSVAGGAALWGSYWSIPFWLVYGVLYGSAMEARWHECVHGAAFRTAWMNQTLYQIASFMMVRNPVVWQWSHARHHADTQIVGRDPEILVKRPPQFMRLFLNIFGIVDAFSGWQRMLANAAGFLSKEESQMVPERDRHLVIRIAGLWTLIYALVLLIAVAFQSILPLMIVGLPRLYGSWHHIMTGVLQHGALAENVVDYRLNTRTVHMNRFSRFICWNGNYHVEHHMFPMVPFHQLPALHELIKHDVPSADRSIIHAYSKVLPVLWKQRANPNLFLRRKLPQGAKPYVTSFLPQSLPPLP